MLQEVEGAKHINSQKLISRLPITKLVANAKTNGIRDMGVKMSNGESEGHSMKHLNIASLVKYETVCYPQIILINWWWAGSTY